MADPVRINGNEYSWASIELKIDGEVYSGFTEISFGHTRSRTKTYGMGRAHAPRARTSGKYEVDETKLVGPLDTVNELKAKLASMSESGKSYGDVEFQITVQYLEGDRSVTVELIDNVITGETVSQTEGPDAIAVELTIDTMDIVIDGLTLHD